MTTSRLEPAAELNLVVNSHNEWDPLEEVLVGEVEGAAQLPWELSLQAVTPTSDLPAARQYHSAAGGKPHRPELITAAKKERDELIARLTAEGVKVVRPEPWTHARRHGTPEWSSAGGNAHCDPRDLIIVFGDEIIEAPMSWRSKYFEFLPYRELIKDYFKRGARWTTAPKPRLSDASFNPNYVVGSEYVLTEHEPLFDAADISRCGRDVFVQRSHTTNDFGIEWLRRHLGDEYRVHPVEFDDYRAIHIDATFVPLCPGKLIVNPDRPFKQVPEVIKQGRWEILTPPRSTLPTSYPAYEAFRWLSLNMLSLDEKRIIVEKNEEPLIQALRDWGFEPIPVPYRSNYLFGGSFHCSTVDFRRRGTLQSYF